MFAHRTHGVVAATLGALGLALAACDDPAQNTDLRPEGPPDVLSVLVMTDAVGGLYETATYCRPNDEKRPSQVGLPDFTTQQVCSATLSEGADEVTDAYPDGWYVRIMFDELLDPNVETLTEVTDEDTGQGTGVYVGSIASTHPVKLECESVTGGGMVEVDYDGYYSPSGNRITWPLGPSLVIKPNDPTLVATSSECQVTILDALTDKQGETVASDQRGPYKFKVAPIQVLEIDPADGDTVDAYTPYGDGMYVMFNTEVDPASICDEGTGMDECEFSFTPDTGGVDFDALSETEFAFYANNPLTVETDYTFSFVEGGKIADRCGKEQTIDADLVGATTVAFTTNPFDLNSATIATNETASPLKRMRLMFSNVVDLATLDASEYSITPAPTTPSVGSDVDNDASFFGIFDLGTEYTFTLNAGATISDVNGAEFTNTDALTITWKTQSAIQLTGSTKDASSFAPDEVEIALSFNQAMDVTTLDATEYTVTDSDGNAVTMDAPTADGCTATDSSCDLLISVATLPTGDYTFTLKMGATIDDQLGNTYTQMADKVIHFTVEDAATPPTPPACL
jgi:hypothetical protein